MTITSPVPASIRRPIPNGLVPKILRKVVTERYDAVLGPKGDLGLITRDRWNLSDCFYETRNRLDAMGYDTSPLNDQDKRKKIHNMVREICEKDLGVKRHEIGIFASDRAQLAFQGHIYNVNLENIPMLQDLGTHVILVEKEGIVDKLVPFTKNAGIALLQSTGFSSEYAVELANAANGYGGANLAILTDFDPAGIGIGLFNFPNVLRIGIDLQSLAELGIDLGLHPSLEESSLNKNGEPTSHWIGLKNNLVNNKDQEGNELTPFYRDYLTKYLPYLKTRRIELNAVMNIVHAEPFWNWLKRKLIEHFPTSNYNRAIEVPDVIIPRAIVDLNDLINNQFKMVLSDSVGHIKTELSSTVGLIENTNNELDSISSNLLKILLQHPMVNSILTDVVKLTNKIKKMQEEGGEEK
jgi:hypothetical protein